MTSTHIRLTGSGNSGRVNGLWDGMKVASIYHMHGGLLRNLTCIPAHK